MPPSTPRVYNRRSHLHSIPDGAVYVGRPSKWGNPFTIGRDGTREEVLAKYADWLDSMVETRRLNLDELQGKDLVCWCAPEPCHADILLELANK